MKIWTRKLNLKTNKFTFLANKIGISHEKIIKQMEWVNQTEVLYKTDRVKERFDEAF